MIVNDWITWVSDACKFAHLEIPRLAQRLSEEAAVQTQEDFTAQVLQFAKGQLSPEQQELASQLVEPVYAFVFQNVEQGQLFCPLDKAYKEYGERIEAALNSGSEEYQKLAKTFMTFTTELDELAESNRALLLYHVLKEVEISIKSVFFPSAGPQSIDVSKREQAMKELLARYAPSLNSDSFFTNNPVLQSEHANAGSFSTEFLGRVILIALTVLAATKVWWAPLIVAPVFWQVWDSIFCRGSRIYASGLRLVADGLTHLVWLSYIGYTIAVMGSNIGHWYGWCLGIVVAIGVAQLLGLLWPHRWHLERIEGGL